jgi:hypothetical protein
MLLFLLTTPVCGEEYHYYAFLCVSMACLPSSFLIFASSFPNLCFLYVACNRNPQSPEHFVKAIGYRERVMICVHACLAPKVGVAGTVPPTTPTLPWNGFNQTRRLVGEGELQQSSHKPVTWHHEFCANPVLTPDYKRVGNLRTPDLLNIWQQNYRVYRV